MPSALVRVRALLPVIREIDKLLHIEGRPSRFLKGTGLILGLLAPAASISILTGGGMSIVAAQTIARLYGPVSWIQWFLMMVPPTLVVSLVMTAYIEVVFPPESARTPAQLSLTGRQVRAGRRREAVAGVVLGLTLLAWLFGSRWNVDFAIPVILAVAVLALPPLRLVSARTIGQQQWDEILVVGSALSLSAAIIDAGTVDWVGRKLFGLLPNNLGPTALYGFVVIFSLIFRQLFLQPSPCIAITLPLVIELGRRTGTDPLLLAMLSAGVIGVVQILPIQSPPSLFLYTEGIYEVRDQLRVSPVLILVTVGVMLLTAFFYWPLLRRVGWVG
jgi:di/tricarboxylate transporter